MTWISLFFFFCFPVVIGVAASALRSFFNELLISSVAQLCPTLWPHGLQHARLPCPSQLPEFTQTHVHRVSDATQPSHPVGAFSCLQPFPASGVFFQMSQFFISGGQNIGTSPSVLPMNIQDWFPLRLTGLISYQSKWQSFLSTLDCSNDFLMYLTVFTLLLFSS